MQYSIYISLVEGYIETLINYKSMEKVIETILTNPSMRSRITEQVMEIEQLFQPWGGE